jgi:hypothetical protein
MANSLRVSRRHGLNPAVERCFVCGEDIGVVLFGELRGDVEAPRTVVLDKAPCEKCQTWMAQGVILISARDGETGDNPYRTGGWCVLKEDAFRRLFTGPEAEATLQKRICFLHDSTWDALGLPRVDK